MHIIMVKREFYRKENRFTLLFLNKNYIAVGSGEMNETKLWLR